MAIPEKAFLQIKYKCMHPSCVVNCRDGDIAVEEGYFKELAASYEGEDVFKSPQGICRMGFPQKFKIVSLEKGSASGGLPANHPTHKPKPNEGAADDPIEILMAEHKGVLKILDEIEAQVRRRDIEALWVLTAALINKVTLHSLIKEEEVLFPLIGDLIPFSEGLIAIVKEDHAEFMNLLCSFRLGLEVGDITDGIINSTIVNLRNHIRKEDEEFFALVGPRLDADIKKRVLEGMRKVDEAFVPMKTGELSMEKAKQTEVAKRRRLFEDKAAAAREARQADAASGGACCHE
jgi:hemerythrin-like domain-containing protein